MPVFAFEAVDASGKKVRDELNANSKDEAIRSIRQKGLRPTRVAQKAAEAKKKPAPGKGQAKKKKGVLFDSVKPAQVVTFTTQLSTLQDAGLPIVRSLKILGEQQRPGKFRDQIENVSEEVEQGSTFSEALGKHPKSFDKLYVSMVKAGEAGGVLDVILRRLAEFMEKSQKLRKKVKGAMIYPAAVVSVAVVILCVIMIFVVPAFEKMFQDIGKELPLPTQILLSISDVLTNPVYMFGTLGSLALVYLLFWWIGRTPKGRYAFDAAKLRLPVFGNIMKKSAVARFCRTLGTLVASGVPILEALRIVKDAIPNVVIQTAIEEVHGSIREGETIADPLRASGIFDELLVNMIDVGEETGELDKMLMKIADNYEADVDVAVEGMSSLLEPLLIVGMGLAVGFIVVALFMPLVSIIQNIG